ncbi:MAG TPA: phosphoglucosamine mutase [Streptosporangiaceae bacterium]|nr:phosphoglucosamine mutase [Streptosporangiaceae bacterium]
MARLFGTDGVRGVAGRDLTARLAMDLSVAAAGAMDSMGAFGTARAEGRRPLAVIGRDPRASGEFLEAAVVAGLAGSGVDVLRLGVVPTPAVAYLTADLGAELGVVLSASHNPAPDNGIKFFSRGGVKLPDAVEDLIERTLSGLADGALLASTGRVPGDGFGRVRDGGPEIGRYLDHLLSTVTSGDGGAPLAGLPLAGLRVVVDCAHGAAYELAPRLLSRAGADVIPIGTEPDGLNINDGVGSTWIGSLAGAVTAHGADAGIAHDGDADRCLAVDARGQVVDGDQILALLAISLRDTGRLAGGTVVTTVMANLGFRKAMAEAGIEVVEVPVGDRYVLEAMREGQFVLGGEQSGHLILLDHATTGDGLLTGLQLLAVMARTGRPLHELARVMTRYPQVLVNVPVEDKAEVAASADLAAAVSAARSELGASGRVLVRPSGTEQAVRVMVEALDGGQAKRVAGVLADTVRDLS